MAVIPFPLQILLYTTDSLIDARIPIYIHSRLQIPVWLSHTFIRTLTFWIYVSSCSGLLGYHGIFFPTVYPTVCLYVPLPAFYPFPFPRLFFTPPRSPFPVPVVRSLLLVHLRCVPVSHSLHLIANLRLLFVGFSIPYVAWLDSRTISRWIPLNYGYLD